MPNLRSLKLNVDGKVSDFNLATLLGGNHALETLYIHLIGEALRGGGHSGKQLQGSGTALRHELQDTLPTRLKNIIIQGPKIENIHPAAFKVMTKFNYLIWPFKIISYTYILRYNHDTIAVSKDKKYVRQAISNTKYIYVSIRNVLLIIPIF